MDPMDSQESLEETVIPPPIYSTEPVDLTTSDTEPNPVLSPSNRRRSRERSKSISKTRLEVFGSSKNMGETGDNLENNEDFDIEDESFMERILGLTEMFPETVRHGFSALFNVASGGIESAYSISRSVTWFVASTATLCFLPLILELERVQNEEQEAVQQRTMMLGPKAAGGGSGLAGFTASVPHLTHMESQ
ncbi:unnamed protein product [Heterobilharzia americana]|nr:unnamed protein product [Heterobilharzia americana]